MTTTVDIRNDTRGTLHVHKAGCGDLRQAKYKAMETGGACWTADVTSQRDVVMDIYPPDNFDYDPATEWQDFAGDVKFYPCLDTLPVETEAEATV